MDEIPVRFVPRGRTSVSFDEMASAPADSLINRIAPSKAESEKGRRALMDRRVAAERTPLNRLITTMNRDAFKDMFGNVQLRAKKVTAKNAITSKETMFTADALEIPDALKDSIAFAYIPTPVEYYAPRAVPPQQSIYHLRISDVQMALNAPRCHRGGLNGSKVRVAMADSGFWLHPYFVRSGFQLIPTESPGSGPADEDESGHGTGESANIFAIAPKATVYGVKQGISAASTLERCIEKKPHVMSNSWGWPWDTQSRDDLRLNYPQIFNEVLDVEQVINAAIDDNIVVMFAAGNGHYSFPASIPNVISVGGVTLTETGDFEASSYASSYQSQIYPGRSVPDVCGLVGRADSAPRTAHIMLPVPPGSGLDNDNFVTPMPDIGWGIFSGTSAACPQAAGLVALLKQIDERLTPAQVRQVLEARSVDITQGKTAMNDAAKAGNDLATGAGLIDALRACGYVGGMV